MMGTCEVCGNKYVGASDTPGETHLLRVGSAPDRLAPLVAAAAFIYG
jgi:hypothetical protein